MKVPSISLPFPLPLPPLDPKTKISLNILSLFLPPSPPSFLGINHLFHSIMMAVMACNTGDIIYVEEGVWGGERGLEIENQDGAIDIRKSLKIEGRGDKEKVSEGEGRVFEGKSIEGKREEL